VQKRREGAKLDYREVHIAIRLLLHSLRLGEGYVHGVESRCVRQMVDRLEHWQVRPGLRKGKGTLVQGRSAGGLGREAQFIESVLQRAFVLQVDFAMRVYWVEIHCKIALPCSATWLLVGRGLYTISCYRVIYD